MAELAGARAAPAAGPAPPSELPPPGSPVHFVGVGGAGMRGLALCLARAGYRVSGCDRGGASGLEELRGAGVRLLDDHDPSHVSGAGLVVYSSAVPADAPELAAARAAGIPTLKRARALGALVNNRQLAGVAGTHGKTTITAMAGLACEAGGLDPTVLVGGRVAAWRGFARPGEAGPAIVEADEYDRSFLELDPWLAVVSSLEAEHLDTYGTLDALRAAYRAFAARAVDRGGVLYCLDDPGARELGAVLGSELSYGFDSAAAYRVEVVSSEPRRQRCRLTGTEAGLPDAGLGFELNVAGRHNAQNATAALAIAHRLGAEPSAAAAGLRQFRGVARRLEELAAAGPLRIVDDYAHHPTEVRASIDGLRGRYPDRRLVVFFQPHLYSRTRAFAADFAAALSGADRALVLPIYPAREEPIPGVTSELIVRAGGGAVQPCEPAEALAEVREARGGPPTAFVFMGAGDVTELARDAARALTDDALGG